MATKLWAIGLVLLCALMTGFAQLFFKIGANKLPLIFFNWPIIIGLAIFAVEAILFVIAYKGGDVSVLFPVFATSYIWVSLVSKYFLGESLNLFKWIGIGTIILGISIIGKGSKMAEQQVKEAKK
jgi:undecaprenyl phosphate-alpha-L-ara4N flippase subunit ArnE